MVSGHVATKIAAITSLCTGLYTLDKFARYVAATAKNPVVLSPRKEYVFILSHMRGRTSRLSHILGSHPEISGHSEMHQGYSNAIDLLKLRCKVSMDNLNSLSGRYVLDKLLFDYTLSCRIMAAPETKVIFLLREPESSLKSIIAHARKYPSVDWHRDPGKVLEYYIARLSHLEDIAKERAKAGAPLAFYFDSELLLNRTTLVLQELTQWLGLTTELSPHYAIFETTGRQGWGDPSNAIKSGRILKSATFDDQIDLDAEILNRARPVFLRCRDTLLALCRTVEGPHAL